jgi:hypothetical protein
MINLPALAERMQECGILNKSFMDMTKTEIHLLISAVFSCPDDSIPPDGWDPVRIEDDTLIITFASHPKYHWWTPDGQSIMETLIELNAPWEVAKKYLCSKLITEEAYYKKLIPF